jgi:hypothetical protein
MSISPGRWERWREDWALVQADAHDRLALPVGSPAAATTEDEEDVNGGPPGGCYRQSDSSHHQR